MTATTTSIKSDTRLEVVTRRVVLKGIRPIMFDRYAGDNDTRLAWHEKIYLVPGTDILCLPVTNIISFYTAHNTQSAPKRLRDARKFKGICNAIQSFTFIEGEGENPEYCPITRKGEVIRVGEFSEDRDERSGLELHRCVARLKDGVPNPKERPLLPLDWEIAFRLSILPNKAIKEAEIRNLTIEGGLAIGLGTYRGVFGKFLVETWEPAEV